MRNFVAPSLLGLSLCVFTGCKSGGSSSSSSAAPASQEASVFKNDAPAGTPFATIKEGMSKDEVQATVGQPTNFNTYQTGKAWIPFHFGGDNWRGEAHYKGMGSVIYSADSAFTSSMSVIEVHYDPSDPGFAKSN